MCGAHFVCVRELTSSPRDAERWRDACVCIVSITLYQQIVYSMRGSFMIPMDYAVSALGIICSAMKIYFQTCEILGSGKFDADKNVSYKL